MDCLFANRLPNKKLTGKWDGDGIVQPTGDSRFYRAGTKR